VKLLFEKLNITEIFNTPKPQNPKCVISK